MINKIFFQLSVLLLFFSINSELARSQQLPNSKPANKRLPAIFKIDGKLSEWNDSLLARNRATGIFYGMANDDKNLYLAVKSADKIINSKIMAGGITLTINTSGKRNSSGGSQITFPVKDNPFTKQNGPTGKPIYEHRGPLYLDSLGIVKEIKLLKEIQISGLKDINENRVSIYNDYGILAKVVYNKDLIYELIIPLQLLGLSPKGVVDFSYGIRLNGVPNPPNSSGTPGTLRFPSTASKQDEMENPTYFWSNYSLAKSDY